MTDTISARDGRRDSAGNARGPDEPFGPPLAERPACAGKGFEHHDSLAWDDALLVRWRCADCGTTGGYAEINERMMPVVPWIDRVRAAMNLYPVILMPSDAKPGFFGDFMGCKVYRVQGIERPMVAIPGLLP